MPKELITVVKVTENPRARGKATFKTLMNRLARAGFKRDFVRSVLLPEWWDEICDEDPNLLSDFEIRVARFLGIPLGRVQDSGFSLVPQQFAGAQLRRVRGIDSRRLVPAIHSAARIAEVTVRCLQESAPRPAIPPRDGLEWRRLIAHSGLSVTLDQMLSDLWLRGIPVVPLEIIPSPSFQAISCIVEGRPVILIGQKYDEPGRVAFWVAHEVGHIARGDCDSDHLILDGEEGIVDNSEIEEAADQYAHHVLVGENPIPKIANADFKAIAKESAQQERLTGIDAGMIVAAWASQTRDYARATMALKALYRSSGARRKTSQHFNKYVDVTTVAESDRDLLRCVYGRLDAHEIGS